MKLSTLFQQRIYIIVLISLLFSSNSYGQAFWDTVFVTPLEICLGDPVDPYSNGDQSIVLMNNDFNNQTIGAGWVSNASPSYTNPCGNDNDGTPHAWIGSSSSFPRNLTTVPYDVTSSCLICFDMKFATQGDPSPCEGPDEMDEGVSLQWSNNGGVTWNDIIYFCPDGNTYPSNIWSGITAGGGASGPFISWANYCYNVPAAAAGPATQFQWHQDDVTDQFCDHWGIDNVLIDCPAPGVNITWHDSYTNTIFSINGDPPLQYPTNNTTFTATIDDGVGSDVATFDIIVNPNPIADAGTGGSYCSDNYTFTAVASIGTGTWTYTGPGNATFAPNVNSPNATVTVDTWGAYVFTWTENSNGCIDSDDVIVTFNYTPTSDFTVVSNAICVGEDAIVTYTGTGSATATYTWDFDGANVNPGTGQGPHTINWNTAGSYDITLTVNESGCTSIVTTIPVSVFEPHTSTFNVTQPLCFGEAGILTYTGTATSSATFNWNYGGGSALPGGTSIGPQNVTYNADGTFNVSLQVTENNCVSNTTNHQVIVPEELSTSVVTTDLVCYGDQNGSADLTVSGGVLPYTYLWSDQSSNEDLSSAPVGDYSVLVTDANQCTIIEYASIIEPDQLVLSPLQNASICNGQSVLLSTITIGGTAPFSYVWDGVTTTNASNLVSPTITTSYSVYAIDVNGCISETESATVNVAPVVTIELFTNDEYVCPGDPALISANILSGVPPYYLYTVDGVITTPFIINPYSNQYIEVFVEDQCSTTASDDITINVYPLPPVSFQADSLNGCAPHTVHFHENNPNINVGYMWNFGDNDYDHLSYDPEPTHIYDEPGLYDVSLTVTSADGCQSTQYISDMITVYPTPNAAFIATPEVASIIKPIISFENFSVMADSYVWLFGDGDTSGTIHPIHMFPIYPTGVYNVALVAVTLNGCKDTAYQEIIIKDEYTFYAPTAFTPDFDGINDIFNVKGNGINKRNFLMVIYDRWGEVIFSTDDLYEGWDGRVNDGDIGKNGTYTWLVKFYDLGGTEHQEAGAVTIVR